MVDLAGFCPCGRPLHYPNAAVAAYVDRVVAELGEMVTITTPDGSWRVSRHFVALHGVAAARMPALAATYGFESA